MRSKRLVLCLTVAFLLLLPSVVQASTLHYGSRGLEVVQFQLTHNLIPDGIAGPITMRAVLTDNIIAEAKSHIGLHYVWGGTSPVSGFDCSGFVQYVFKQNRITLPRVSVDQSKVGSVISYANLQPGDLMFFSINNNGKVTHVGIYIGNGQMLGSEAKGIRVVDITTSYWTSRFIIARRVY